MTIHPINNSVSGAQGTPTKITTPSSGTVSKSKGVSLNTVSASVGVAQSFAKESISLELSTEGIQKLQSTPRSPIKNQDDAKSLLKEVTESIKENVEQNASLHSNLRAMRVNQLVFD